MEYMRRKRMMIAAVLVGLVAVEHIYILILEMFLWTTPRGMKAFGTTREEAAATKALAANQGLYNGFLAAGLIWGLVHPNELTGRAIELFFLVCVLIAALYGGATAKKSIWLVQGLPALIAFVFVLIQH
jgi:putative membrane protein